jgi:hypothetical protein
MVLMDPYAITVQNSDEIVTTSITIARFIPLLRNSEDCPIYWPFHPNTANFLQIFGYTSSFMNVFSETLPQTLEQP